MNNHLNPHGATPFELKEQELEDNLFFAEFALKDSKTLEEKRNALNLIDSALIEIDNHRKTRQVDFQWDNQSWAEQRG